MLAAATAVMAQSKIEVLHEQEAPEFEPEPELPAAAKLEIENVIDLAHTTANTPELEPDLLPAAKPDILGTITDMHRVSSGSMDFEPR